ncbi:hypothetical protein [Clostridium sp. ZS2-4]|uniref:hypothetical protein n=1 Tax=Clostridium sp. ZS2-4 TaxID=2987703 RepID=UPI00227A4C53|nr:hypothetical protein [Clostridium sp. ZS2-4]MCY6356026.1 hypothetical protein [Clostridium sp. ZS2-4]
MGYTIIDVIDKLIMIKMKVREIYSDTSQMNTEDKAFNLVTIALMKVQEKHIKYYNGIKETIGKDIEEIDFLIYDKISFLIDEYKNRVDFLEVNPKNMEEILNLALDFEKKNSALIIDIQGRLVKKETDVQTETYNILSEMIEKEQKYLNDLKQIIEKTIMKK